MADEHHQTDGAHDGAHEPPHDPPAGRPATAPLAGAAASRESRALRTIERVHTAAGFVARVAELGLPEVRAFIRDWHQSVAADAEGWFAAEAAVAEAVVRSRRPAEQRALLVAMAEAFTNAVWYRRRVPIGAGPASSEQLPPDFPSEQGVGATEASGQYSATLAMIAWLVRDHIEQQHFDVIYAPFARLIPAAELEDAAGTARE